MTSKSGRRQILVCLVAVAALVAVIAPASASAESDLSQQCSGSAIKGRGSSFQNPILQTWVVGFHTYKEAPNKNILACGGTQGSLGEPKVEYLSGGSGACLHAWGTEGVETPKFKETAYCGTDEAPNATQKAEMESFKTGGEGRSIETIPTVQGSVAVLVHLPAGCKAQSEIEKSGKKYKLGRLVLDNSSLEGVYSGAIKTWKALIENQKAGHDKLTCTVPAEEENTITPVVRLDHSGTTHIFKTWLEQVDTAPLAMEAYPEEIGGKKTGCGKALPEETEPWSATAEACQNQRWPTAAKILRGTESGNPGVVKRVNETASSIGYADLAVARELKFFSAKGFGGENKKGTETKLGEQNVKFWAELQDTATPTDAGYADPASNADIEKRAQSNCAATVYTNEAGKKFPPESTRELWNGAKAELVQKKYSLCGLSYDLVLRQYAFYPGLEGAEGKAIATSTHDFLLWAINPKLEGGGSLIKLSDYEKLPSTLIKKAEAGVKDIGFEKAGGTVK